MTNPDTLSVVEQACADLAADGHAVTLTAVAERTGLSRTTLYRELPGELLEFLSRKAGLPEDGPHRPAGDLTMVGNDDRAAVVVPELYMAAPLGDHPEARAPQSPMTSRAAYVRTDSDSGVDRHDHRRVTDVGLLVLEVQRQRFGQVVARLFHGPALRGHIDFQALSDEPVALTRDRSRQPHRCHRSPRDVERTSSPHGPVPGSATFVSVQPGMVRTGVGLEGM